jgi:hypothetical protein
MPGVCVERPYACRIDYTSLIFNPSMLRSNLHVNSPHPYATPRTVSFDWSAPAHLPPSTQHANHRSVTLRKSINFDGAIYNLTWRVLIVINRVKLAGCVPLRCEVSSHEQLNKCLAGVRLFNLAFLVNKVDVSWPRCSVIGWTIAASVRYATLHVVPC